MYIAEINLATDQQEITDFIMKYSFGTIVTAVENTANASHLPFVVYQRKGKTILTAHFAKANIQWKELVDREVLVIFTEPHAYISPKHYDKELNVPTWNYIAVHAYGKAKLITEEHAAMEVLERTINNYETEYIDQWNRLPDDYKAKMVKGIVAFEIEVDYFQASKKLSQNKNEAEKQRIIKTLSESPDQADLEISRYMAKENGNP
jgi:transcriptional regulator